MKISLVIAAFLWCATAQADETPTIPTPADLEVVRHKIEGNWNVPVSERTCLQVIAIRIDIGTGGTVDEVILLDPDPIPQACQQTMESAKRAIWKSSPLPVPEGVDMLRMNFDPTKLQ